MSISLASLSAAIANVANTVNAPVADDASDYFKFGVAIARAEYEVIAGEAIANDAKKMAKDSTARTGAYVALGKAMFTALIRQQGENAIDALASQSKFNAELELKRLGVEGETLEKRMKAIAKGISRARTSAKERMTGKTAKGAAISVPMLYDENEFDSVETESDRDGRKRAADKASKGKEESRMGTPARKQAETARQVLGAWKSLQRSFGNKKEGAITQAMVRDIGALENAMAAFIKDFSDFLTDDPAH